MPLNQAMPIAALRRIAGPPPDARPDEQLLRSYCADRDEAAFAAIVRRHGGLVLDVCRTALRNDADAEDAFQATFVALATQARRVRCPAALAGWLHAVAWRTAAKARRARDRRRTRESHVPPRSDEPAVDPSWREVRRAIHEEVNRLPDRYRSAVILHYLVGQTQDEVGRALGLSTAGAKKRLERGRALLRSALARRGFGPTAVLATAAISLPALQPALATNAAELAVRFVMKHGPIPAAVHSLVINGVRPMSVKVAFGAALLLGVATTVGLGVLKGGPSDQPGGPDVTRAQLSEEVQDPKRPSRSPGTTDGDESPKKVPVPATALDRFRALEPAERLKFIVKLAGNDTPFGAATRGDLDATIVERGSIDSANSADVICTLKAPDKASVVASTIKWVVDDGRLVKKGERLVVLDDTKVREQLQAATVKTKRAEATMIAALENIRAIQAENDVTVRLAEIDVKLAAIDLEDVAPGKKKQVLELKVEQSKLNLERTRVRGKAQLTKAEAELRAQSAEFEQESLRQKAVETELLRCTLMAPADGLVVFNVAQSSRFGGAGGVVAEGEPVREGQKLLRVLNLTQLVIATRVPEAVISSVRTGQMAQVRVDAFPDRLLRGKVTQVSPVAATSDWRSDIKVYPVTIAIEDAPAGLKPNMSGEVQIATGRREAVVQVPLKAIIAVGQDRICFVKSGQELIERKVVTGASNGQSIEIREGLKEGEVVVTDPPSMKLDGAKGKRN